MYGIVGLGLTGFSCLQYLTSQGHPCCVFDTREAPGLLSRLRAEYPQVTFKGGSLCADDLKGVQTLVMSPGLPVEGPFFEAALAQKIPMVGDIELFMQAVQAPVIGVTGTNGKSTVTTLVYALLKDAGYCVKVGGNLGPPALDLLSGEPAQVYVLELSSYQLELVHHLPLLSATILNIAPDHLDRHGTMQNYIQAKQRIYQEAQQAVVNRVDRETEVQNVKVASSIPIWRFGLAKPESVADFGIDEVNGEPYFMQGKDPICAVSTTPLVGLHNQENILAALALVASFKIPFRSIQKTLSHFNGLPHRCQVVCKHRGITWINDSKGTNVAASISAMKALKPSQGKLIVLLGGKPKQEDYSLLIPTVLECARGVVLMGGAISLLKPLWEPYRSQIALRDAHSMQEAIQSANELAESGDIVLLSPACPSYDWYQNFEERGHDFVRQLEELVKATNR